MNELCFYEEIMNELWVSGNIVVGKIQEEKKTLSRLGHAHF